MKKRTAAILVVVLLLLLIGIWRAWGRGDDAQLRKVEEMGRSLRSGDGPPNREAMDQFRKEMEKLTPDQREKFREQMRKRWEREQNKKIDEYFSLPPDQRKAYLDRQIQEEEQRRKDWESRRSARNTGNPGDGQNRAAGGGPGSPRPGAGQNPQGPGGGRGRNMTAEQRAQRRNQRLDNSTPDQRAKHAEYHAALQKRRIELGLPAHGGHGPR